MRRILAAAAFVAAAALAGCDGGLLWASASAMGGAWSWPRLASVVDAAAAHAAIGVAERLVAPGRRIQRYGPVSCIPPTPTPPRQPL